MEQIKANGSLSPLRGQVRAKEKAKAEKRSRRKEKARAKEQALGKTRTRQKATGETVELWDCGKPEQKRPKTTTKACMEAISDCGRSVQRSVQDLLVQNEIARS